MLLGSQPTRNQSTDHSRPQTPRILLESIAWFTTRNWAKVKKILVTLQNAVNRLILGPFCSSPTSLLTHDANNLSFSDQLYARITQSSTRDYRRRHITQHDDCQHVLHNTPFTHQVLINLLIGKRDLLMTSGTRLDKILPYPAQPWDTPLCKIENLDLDKDQPVTEVKHQVTEEADRVSLVILRMVHTFKRLAEGPPLPCRVTRRASHSDQQVASLTTRWTRWR